MMVAALGEVPKSAAKSETTTICHYKYVLWSGLGQDYLAHNPQDRTY